MTNTKFKNVLKVELLVLYML